jgi:hypothetical protein
MKNDGHLGRCYLKGRDGHAANAILTAVGYPHRAANAFFSGKAADCRCGAAAPVGDDEHLPRLCTRPLPVELRSKRRDFHPRGTLWGLEKGSKPDELVEQPTKFDLVVNSKIAVTLGLAVNGVSPCGHNATDCNRPVASPRGAAEIEVAGRGFVNDAIALPSKSARRAACNRLKSKSNSGSPGRIRTSDHSINSRMLYH